jgi:hypothetical protein
MAAVEVGAEAAAVVAEAAAVMEAAMKAVSMPIALVEINGRWLGMCLGMCSRPVAGRPHATGQPLAVAVRTPELLQRLEAAPELVLEGANHQWRRRLAPCRPRD